MPFFGFQLYKKKKKQQLTALAYLLCSFAKIHKRGIRINDGDRGHLPWTDRLNFTANCYFPVSISQLEG